MDTPLRRPKNDLRSEKALSMRRSVYILAGFAGLIVGALLLAWQILGSATGFSGSAGLNGATPQIHSVFIAACAICTASAWFLWRVLGPPK
jgi:hypothetical protein